MLEGREKWKEKDSIFLRSPQTNAMELTELVLEN